MAIPKPNIATAAKTATTSAAVNADVLAAAAKQSPLINANQVQNQGTDGSSQDKKPRPGFEGPSPNIPDVSKQGYTPATADSQQATINNALGLVSKTDAMKQLAGVGTSSTAAQSAKDLLTDLMGSTSTNNKPGIEQGFGPSPDGAALAAMVGGGKGGKNVMNPMAPYQGGSVGGPLGKLAGAGIKSLADFDKSGLFSIESNSAEKAGVAAGKVAGGAMFLETVTGGGTAAVIKETALVGRVFAVSQAGITTAGAVAAVAGAFAAGVGVGTLANEAATLGLSKATGKDNYTLGDLIFDVVHRDVDASATKPAPGGGVGTPDPDKPYGNDYIISQSMLDQLIVSKAGRPTTQGGSGDATPVDNGGIPQVVNNGSVAVNQGSINQRNLVGQPGGAALGENVSGGNKGINSFGRSNGAGAIDPGNEAGIPSGDPRFQQDPANALPGNKPAPTLRSPVGTQENQSSSVSTTLAAGARNLTLTGTALINGTGNALDNVINGNSAANELRGEAGNDSLNGGSGRDQLTGGSGADRFRFATPGAFGTAQADRITDFSRSEGDKIELSRSAFGLAAGATLSFQAVNSDAELTRALGSSSLLIQDLRNGSILFNQNGTVAGAGQGGVFAMVNQGLILQAGDFALGA
jgi:Ca2+-binding RTX toxin-like protein